MTAAEARQGNTNARLKVADPSRPPWLAWRTKSRSARCVRFIESYLVVPKGHGAGQSVRVAPFQRELLEQLLDDDTLRSAVVSMPRGQGKSTLTAAVALWALHDDEHSPQVPVVATTIMQAVRTIYSTCVRMTEVSPDLADRTLSYSAIGATRLYVPWNNGTLLPLAADPAGLQGLDPSFAVVDEVGFVSQALWDSMVLASGKRPRSLVLGIGTPNVEQSGAMFELRGLVAGGAELPGFRYVEYAADAGCDIHDREQWRKANPAIGAGFLDEEALAMAAATSPEPSFRVFRLGQWAQAAECWLPIGAWDACADPWQPVDGAASWVGIDVSLRRDSCAVAMVQRRPDGRWHVTVRTWDPSAGRAFDVDAAMAHLRGLCDAFDVQSIAYDPRSFDLPGRTLLDEGLPMVEAPQTVERMSPACGYAFEQIVAGTLTHDGDKVFGAHVTGAQSRPNERGWTLSKSKSRRPIDGAVAMILALAEATAERSAATPEKVLFFL